MLLFQVYNFVGFSQILCKMPVKIILAILAAKIQQNLSNITHCCHVLS